jgi:hypothetical protein
MAGENSALPYGSPSNKDLGDAFGAPVFEGEHTWTMYLNGFIEQGGRVSIPTASGELQISFPNPFTKQLLNIQLQPLHSSGASGGTVKLNSESLNGFTIINAGEAKSYYWRAIGV